jgi:ABC-type glycerol-3-phosphate transport system substrate-binding protein
MGSFYQKNPQQRASVEELDSSVVEPPYAGWDKASTDINTELLAALTGSKSPMAALRTAATQVNSDLAQH